MSLQRRKSGGYRTIKDLVLSLVRKTRGRIGYDAVTKRVLGQFPNSAWKKSHWAWYKYQIRQGRFADQFDEETKRNLGGSLPRRSPARRRVRNERTAVKIVRIESRLTSAVQRKIAEALAGTAVFISPAIVKAIANANGEYRSKFKDVCPRGIDISDYLFDGSACVFPGVRRFVGIARKEERQKYIPSERAVMDDNIFPRHIWTFLAVGKPYSAPTARAAGLDRLELAHIFSHKKGKQELEERCFRNYSSRPPPFALFTCAGNVVLFPRGLAKPTDQLEEVRIAFFKRYVDLYGEAPLPWPGGLKNSVVPDWYGDLKWRKVWKPPDWEKKVKYLLEYRHRRLSHIFRNAQEGTGK